MTTLFRWKKRYFTTTSMLRDCYFGFPPLHKKANKVLYIAPDTQLSLEVELKVSKSTAIFSSQGRALGKMAARLIDSRHSKTKTSPK